MPLKEEFEKSGNWLFRWRSYLPLLLIGILMVGLREFEYPGQSEIMDDLWEIICLAISFSGLGIRIFTIGHTPKRTSGRNTSKQVADTLNTTGIYSLVRHPLYLGNFFIWLGISLFAHLWWLTLICILVFWVYYERIMFAEEAFLRNKFGSDYENWAGNTPAFIPKMRGWKKPDLPFSVKNVLKREYNGFFGIIIMFTFLEVAGDYFAEGKLELDLMWGLIFGTGFVVFVMLRTLKKRTNILSEKGR
ncbi:MAG: isoprenylcysteine carboxylmethyltransferase family protein [Pseudomonadota bacterium]|nr:isoprenylcysteine carboxylmethyltransferase family protein [Pseudomonadota bacterium]MBU1397929.1 isoprenylcysteine carboxylmethyltransferase family protein [Pseudomonadota bacterium]MBU1569135.1 isoprenylcysteine carboxylmethyltransferase family protein [Pseudomonadota bacterium]